MKILAGFLNMTAAFFIGVASQMQGWGLQPHSWGWIIGCWVALLVVMVISTALAER